LTDYFSGSYQNLGFPPIPSSMQTKPKEAISTCLEPGSALSGNKTPKKKTGE